MTLIRTLLTTIFAFIIAYIKGWQLAFVMTGILPLCIMTTYLYINAVQNRQKKVNESYSKAGGMA
jgi:ATP-binding cassette subfamily B (MDR/TAP) protein 1